jgi:hypothetical protein
MSPEEWIQCDNPYRMLWYLRGEVAETDRKPRSTHNYEGVLYTGGSPHATREQCIAYAIRSQKLWSLVAGRPEGEYRGRWGEQAEEVTDIFGTEDYTSHAAWDAADIVAAESIRVTCPDPTEDDLWAWGWGGGPPDPLWQATHKAFRVLQASMLRSIFSYPNIPTPTTGSCRPGRYAPSHHPPRKEGA